MNDAPPLLSLPGAGMWLWMPSEYGITADACRRMGIGWVGPEAAVSHVDGQGRGRHDRRDPWSPAIARAKTKEWHADGIGVLPFLYPISATAEMAEAEADTICACIDEGADAVGLDMETPYEGAEGPARAARLAEAIDRKVPHDFPLFDQPWAWIGSHGGFKAALRTLAPRMSAHMPQAYTTAFGYSHAASALGRMDREWVAEMAQRPPELRREVWPIFALFDATSMAALGQPHPEYGTLDLADLDLFTKWYRTRVVSYWSLRTARTDALDKLVALTAARASAPPAPLPTIPAPPPPLDSDPGTGAGDWRPEHYDTTADALASLAMPAPRPSDRVPTMPSTPSAIRQSEQPPPA